MTNTRAPALSEGLRILELVASSGEPSQFETLLERLTGGPAGSRVRRADVSRSAVHQSRVAGQHFRRRDGRLELTGTGRAEAQVSHVRGNAWIMELKSNITARVFFGYFERIQKVC